MDKETVEKCLAFGASLSDNAHIKNRKRMGAFGVGLPQRLKANVKDSKYFHGKIKLHIIITLTTSARNFFKHMMITLFLMLKKRSFQMKFQT